ncbi:hypothetical protein WJX73_008731 [Symbiochloris irregularis]|uniref:BLOC-1-related complex subunit 6 C-terminal helix domain-containing protein n=1 Tax=Symbiochloris irregularis TaxID=706552 RepID=A0AAW1NVA3_9CHLO
MEEGQATETRQAVDALALNLEQHATLLSQEFDSLLTRMSATLTDASQASLDSLNIYAEATQAVEEASTSAVQEGQELIRRCTAMARELRGTDILADRELIPRSDACDPGRLSMRASAIWAL